MSTSDPWSTPTPRRSRCAPAVVADVPNDSRLVQDESTGPVLTVQVFNTEEEAVALANGTSYGLAAGLHTTDVARVATAVGTARRAWTSTCRRSRSTSPAELHTTAAAVVCAAVRSRTASRRRAR
jgi:hypothetical protein